MIVIQFSQAGESGSPSGCRSGARRRRDHESCDDATTRTLKTVIQPAIIIQLLLLLLILIKSAAAEPGGSSGGGAAADRPSQLAEYQLIGQVSQEAHLPCLIGRQLYCGEPYFIAWYKLNSSSKSWVRIEHKSDDELQTQDNTYTNNGVNHYTLKSQTSLPVNERVHFSWTRSSGGQQARNSWRPACDHQHLPAAAAIGRHVSATDAAAKLEMNFDCATLTIRRLELIDEGQYKCEITFSESLDFDKCPATTLSQLSVIARPNEPELLINGRPLQPAGGGQQQQPQLTFKEGAQVKLDCLSSGGRPAPRIEWLNVSSAAAGPPEVQLMRAHWPQKKSSYVESAGAGGYTQAAAVPLPVTSSSVTISVTRHDLHSQFVCVVLPQAHAAFGGGGASANLDQLIKSPAYLSALMASAARPAASNHLQQQQQQQQSASMFKWLKLDVQVKPSNVALLVRDLETDATLEPVHWSQQQQQQQAHLAANRQQLAGYGGLIEHHMSPFYSLQPNRLYAVQCVVENSRPQSQLAWFNRTAPVALEARQVNASDYVLPADPQRHRLSSFARSIGHANGTFRSSATLLLTTNVWDNFEELFCRVSNEAFQFDELLQVAPIISARLYVNYAPFAWLEAPAAAMQDRAEPPARPIDYVSQPAAHVITLSRASGSELTLRCSLAANPLGQNTILQIEWLKDGRKLATPGGGAKSGGSLQQPSSRFHIERANHLHMPAQASLHAGSAMGDTSGPATSGAAKGAAGLGNQLVASSKLLAFSTLTVSSLARADSGSYACQYKLIPAPSGQLASGQTGSQHQQQIRITSGKANQTIQVNVIEAKPRAPTLRLLSSRGLLVYGPLDKQQSPPDGQAAKYSHRQLLTVVVQPDASISLKCHLPPSHSQQAGGGNPRISAELAHKIIWHLNGAPIHSSGAQDMYYNFSLSNRTSLPEPSDKDDGGSIGLLSCAHHILSPDPSSPDNFHGGQMRVLPSANQVELRLKVGPILVAAKRELMPPMRSFSELELNANPANKLRLVCMAACEPVCSIDWYLNRRPLGAAAGSGVSQRAKWGHRDLQQQFPITAAARNATAMPFVLSRTFEMDADVEGGVGGIDGSMVQVENLIGGVGNAINGTSNRFSWYKATSLCSSAAAAAAAAGEPDLAARHLSMEALETLHHLAPNKANVFSKLELSYGQLSQLLIGGPSSEANIKCKLNPMLNGQRAAAVASSIGVDLEQTFGHAQVEPMRWFPAADGEISASEDGAAYSRERLTNEPLNLINDFGPNADKQSAAAGAETDANEADFGGSNWSLNSDNIKPADLHARKLLSSGLDDRRRSQQKASADAWPSQSGLAADEMQITVLLDRAPKSVSVSFGGIVSTDREALGVTITESQLLELMDPSSVAPLLWCQVSDNPYPRPQFKWTFTDSNRSEHVLAAYDGPQLNLRQVIASRQSQLNVDPKSAYGAEIIASIVGNYTCMASNIYGVKSATLPIQIQGRPLCKLTLGSEYLGPDNELLANLRCLIYSAPSLLETVWFRGSQQLALNKSVLFEPTTGQQASIKSSVSVVELPIVVLNKQQDFMLMDLMNQLANFKCIARNPLGYSEACELSQADKLTLINTFKPISGLGRIKSPQVTMDIAPSFAGSIKSGGGALLNFLTNSTSIDLGGTSSSTNQQQTKIEPRITWSLITFCAVILIAWLLIILIRCVVKRCYTSGSSKFPSAAAKHNHNTSWRFNPATSNSRTSSNSETMALPFQSKTICVNYYGDSNGGDSEHDMMQSCSQSSHYEEFQTSGNQNHQMQQPPVYFNGHSTLTRRTLKPSLSTSSAGDSSTGGRHHQAQQQQQLAVRHGGEKAAREFIGPLPNGHHHTKLAATMRESLATTTTNRYHNNSNNSSSGGLTLTSNVPLINGAHNSRINLDQQPTQNYRFQRDQQTFGSRIEPIYDDVIYNQMIL